jgi:hypothetical protein
VSLFHDKNLTPNAAVPLWRVFNLQGQGLVLQLRKAALQWTVPEEQGKLNGTLLLQDFTLSAGAHAAATAAACVYVLCVLLSLLFWLLCCNL